MLAGYVRELWRYPVKSVRGERLERARIDGRGIRYDRGYALLDEETGKIASAKRPRLWGRLLQCQARVVATDGAVAVALPDGREVSTDRDDVDAALSALTRRRVRLIHTPPDVAEIERYWPDVEGLALHNTVTSGAIGQGAPAGTFFDYAPLHLLSTATLAHLQALYAAGQVDARRFRSNLLIDIADAAPGFVENEWVGRTIQIGDSVRLRVTDLVPRYVVPTLPQGSLVEDIGIVRAVAQHNRPPAPEGRMPPCLGVYVSIERDGEVAEGDVLRWVE